MLTFLQQTIAFTVILTHVQLTHVQCLTYRPNACCFTGTVPVSSFFEFIQFLDDHSFNFLTVFTARRNARIASAVLAIPIPSVRPPVRPSVTRWYCVKTTARITVQFALPDS